MRDGRVVTPRREWAWLVPVVGGAFAVDAAVQTGLLLLAGVAGLALGANWQWLNRRALTRRLAVPAALVVVLAVLTLVEGAPALSARLAFWAGVVVGLVALEHLLRLRERRATLPTPP